MPPDPAQMPITGDDVAAVVLRTLQHVEAEAVGEATLLFHDPHVRVTLYGRVAMVHLRFAVRYGVRLPEVLPRVQDQIETRLQAAFGLASVHLSIDVKDVYFDEAG